jgi:hypothetical protein
VTIDKKETILFHFSDGSIQVNFRTFCAIVKMPPQQLNIINMLFGGSQQNFSMLIFDEHNSKLPREYNLS